jgi:hypothetical protein
LEDASLFGSCIIVHQQNVHKIYDVVVRLNKCSQQKHSQQKHAEHSFSFKSRTMVEHNVKSRISLRNVHNRFLLFTFFAFFKTTEKIWHGFRHGPVVFLFAAPRLPKLVPVPLAAKTQTSPMTVAWKKQVVLVL